MDLAKINRTDNSILNENGGIKKEKERKNIVLKAKRWYKEKIAWGTQKKITNVKTTKIIRSQKKIVRGSSLKLTKITIKEIKRIESKKLIIEETKITLREE